MYLKNVNADELQLNEYELAGRLSVRGRVDYTADERYKRLLEAASCAYVAERFPITRCEDSLMIGDIRVFGSSFPRVARESSECFLMVATLGIGVDRLIAKEQHLSVSDAFVIDAMADALIEALCDTAEREITKGSVCAPRFSPGYADLPLEVGREIVKRLGADVRLGIGFTESGLMIPRKSVSAIVCVRDKIGETEDEKYT